jgi:hypothetical protein
VCVCVCGNAYVWCAFVCCVCVCDAEVCGCVIEMCVSVYMLSDSSLYVCVYVWERLSA